MSLRIACAATLAVLGAMSTAGTGIADDAPAVSVRHLLRRAGQRDQRRRMARTPGREARLRPGRGRAPGDRRRADPLLGHQPLLRRLLPQPRTGRAPRRAAGSAGHQLRPHAPHGLAFDLGQRAEQAHDRPRAARTARLPDLPTQAARRLHEPQPARLAVVRRGRRVLAAERAAAVRQGPGQLRAADDRTAEDVRPGPARPTSIRTPTTPYTDEPAVAMVEINNENALFAVWGWNQIDRLPEPYATTFRRLWNAWLRKKYGDTAALRKAWNVGTRPLGEEMLGNGDFSKPLGRNLEPRTRRRDPGRLVRRAGGPRRHGAVFASSSPAQGSVSWHPQFTQPGFAVKKGEPYR